MYIFGIVTLVILNIVDLVLTLVGVSYGYFEESNPVFKNWVENKRYTWIIVIKLGFLMIACGLFLYIGATLITTIGLVICNIIYLWILYRHIVLIKIVRGAGE